MKKCRKILFILVAAVFTFALFAFTACGGGGGEDGDEVSIMLNKTSLTLEEGKSGTLTATVQNTEEAVVWTVSQGNDKITISADGKNCTVNAVAEGTAKVKAAVGEKSAECTVTVTEAQQQQPVVTIALSATAVNLTMDDSAIEVTATVTGTQDAVTWSATGNCVTLTPNGNTVSVAPAAIGTGKLKAEIGSVKEEIPVTVTKAPVTLTLDKTSVELDLDEEETETTVTATVANNEGKVEWTIGNPHIATIVESDDGLTCTVTAQKIGVTTLTASVDDGAASKTIDVVVNGTPDLGQVSLLFNVNDPLELLTGGHELITATVEGFVGTPDWEITEGNDVISLSDTSGMAITVTALKPGNAVLTATVGNGTQPYGEASINIHVYDPTTITFDKTEINLVNAQDRHYQETLTATVAGKDANETVTWSIVDGSDDCITLSDTDTNTITITAKAAGTATVMAKIGDVEETIEVTVAEPVTLTIDHDTLELTIGGADGTITATVTGTTDTISYRITDGAAYITVTQNGNVLTVTAVAEGTATIEISVGDQTEECTVTVSEPVPLPVWQFDRSMTHGEAGGSIWHQVWNNDITNGMPVDIVVKVNDAVVNPMAVLVQTGTIQIQIHGSRFDRVEATFTFKDAGGEAIATASYSYEPEDELLLDEEEVSIQIDNTKEVSIVTFNGSNDLSGKTILWTIEDVDGTGVASIPAGSNGTSVVITALAEGTARLTCTVGDATATCEITVVEGQVQEQPPVDVTGLLHQQEVYGTWNIGIRLDCDADLGSKITAVEVTATMDGESVNVVVHEIYGTNPKYVKMGVPQDWTHTYVFTLNYKNAAGKVIATGTYTKAPEKSIKLSVSTLNLELGVTDEGTVTATLTGNPSGEIAWSIDGNDEIATIQVSADKMSVTVTAVGAGTATITASIDSMTATCKVVVVEEGDTPTEPIVTDAKIYVYGGDVHCALILYGTDELADRYAEVVSQFAYIKVNGTKNNDMKDGYAFPGEGEGSYRFNVYMGGTVQAGVEYVFEICAADGTVLLKAVLQWDGTSKM